MDYWLQYKVYSLKALALVFNELKSLYKNDVQLLVFAWLYFTAVVVCLLHIHKANAKQLTYNFAFFFFQNVSGKMPHFSNVRNLLLILVDSYNMKCICIRKVHTKTEKTAKKIGALMKKKTEVSFCNYLSFTLWTV